MCVSAYERLSFYALNGSIARWGGVIEMHLMDSQVGISEVEWYYTLNNSITMITVAHVEMDLMELPT